VIPSDQLYESGAGRVPELLPIRYGRMMQSPFAFYRERRPLWRPISRDAVHRYPRASLRRLPFAQLRVIRNAGTADNLRYQRLR